jgi:hypothetical protein
MAEARGRLDHLLVQWGEELEAVQEITNVYLHQRKQRRIKAESSKMIENTSYEDKTIKQS